MVRRLLTRQEPLAAGERVMVMYPGPGHNRYPAVLKEQAGIGPAWQIEWYSDFHTLDQRLMRLLRQKFHVLQSSFEHLNSRLR